MEKDKKPSFSKKILKLLSEKPALSVAALTEQVASDLPQKSVYALTRSLKGLQEASLVEEYHSGQSAYMRLTRDGRRKAQSIKLDSDNALFNPAWDGKWRIILLDISEDRKAEREAVRYLLKKAGFVCLKNSAWISMQPFEHFFRNIKKDLGFTNEMIILTTDDLDKETEEAFLKLGK